MFKKARPIQKDGTLQRVLVGGPGPAPTMGHPPWVGPPGASTRNEHAAFSESCFRVASRLARTASSRYKVRMVEKAEAVKEEKVKDDETGKAGFYYLLTRWLHTYA